MLKFKLFYILISCLLVLTQVVFLAILLYNKFLYGRVLYYGNSDETNPGFEKYFITLKVLLYSTLILTLIWGVLTPFTVLTNRRLDKHKINISIGVIGFVLAIMLLVLDPFGILKWFTH